MMATLLMTMAAACPAAAIPAPRPMWRPMPRPAASSAATSRNLRPEAGPGGLVIALRIEGRTSYFSTGMADKVRSGKRPITTDTLFNLASLRKVFEATLLAQAVRQGELALEDPVAKHVAELRQGGDIRKVRRPARNPHVGASLSAGSPALAGVGILAARVRPHAERWKAEQEPGKQHLILMPASSSCSLRSSVASPCRSTS